MEIRRVDLSDVLQFPEHKGESNYRGTRIGKLIHEVYEQYILQGQEEGKYNFESAHSEAIKAESQVDGVMRHDDSEFFYLKGTPSAMKIKDNAAAIDTYYECDDDCAIVRERAVVKDKRRELPVIKETYPDEQK